MEQKRYLVTGATGFIGGRLSESLLLDGQLCRCVARRPKKSELPMTWVDLHDHENLVGACEGVHVAFHCAGYAHAFSSMIADEAAHHWHVNYHGTRNLLEAAGESGVKSFVFLSSVKAMAEPGAACVDEDFAGKPITSYGQAKRAAEEAVLAAGRRYGMHVVNLRLSMVYGAGGRGNLERMARWLKRGCFPPLPETRNRRSLVHVNDVIEVMRLVAEDSRANGRTYIVSGPQAPSGRELYNELQSVLGLTPVHLAVPYWCMQRMARLADLVQLLTRRRLPFNTEVMDRLLASAWYSAERIEKELGWRAKVHLQEGLMELCR